MALLWESVPDAEILLAMSPEEIGFHIIGHIRSQDDPKAHAGALADTLFSMSAERYPRQLKKPILDAVMEGWTWLQSEALLVLTDGTSNGWHRLSRRAVALADPKAFTEYRASRLLPREILHPIIRDRVWLNVMRGDYDLAVFEAMKAVEIAVRDASGIEGVGQSMLREAFHPKTGPLTDKLAIFAEREARMHLFSGAFGSYRNPISHRHVPLDEAGEVIEQIMLANHMLRIVYARRAAASS